MKLGNVAGKLDLSKPFTQADIRRALGKTKTPTIRDVAKAGYGLEFLRPSIVAQAAGTSLRQLPRFVKA